MVIFAIISRTREYRIFRDTIVKTGIFVAALKSDTNAIEFYKAYTVFKRVYNEIR